MPTGRKVFGLSCYVWQCDDGVPIYGVQNLKSILHGRDLDQFTQNGDGLWKT